MFGRRGFHPLPPEQVDTREVRRILESLARKPDSTMAWYPGEPVRVIEGPFSDFVGTIDEVRRDRQTMTVIIDIFGRDTVVELDFLQVERR